MERKVVSGIMLAVFLIGMLTLAFDVQPVRAAGTIYIRADGSIDPTSAPIQRDGDLYIFTADIYDSIVVERSNIVVDGDGYTLHGPGSYPAPPGINLTGVSNVTIKNTTIKRHWYAILLSGASSSNVSRNTITECGGILINASSNYNSISGNNITGNGGYGIALQESSNNSISGNNIANNPGGIFLKVSSNYNSISANNIANNYYSIWLDKSSNNKFYRNNFINSTVQQVGFQVSGYANVWDDGYPSGGNYWSDYAGVDGKSGSGQDELLGDGIGDTAYVIDADNTDSYPLMAPIRTFNAGTWNGVTYHVDISSNSAISNFAFSQENKQISFNVTGADGTGGFSRVVIPKQLLWVENGWVVFVGWTQVGPIVAEDANYTYLYFTYSLSTETVIIKGTQVISEFPTWMSMLLIFLMLTVAIVIYKRRLLKTPIH